MAETVPTERGLATRSAIAAAADTLFRERGYARTTMRAVAEEAGVSLGNAYYYFPSKDHLVQATYLRLQLEHAGAATTGLGGSRSFDERLRVVLLAFLDVAAPDRELIQALVGQAADPRNPLSPFGADSRPAREASTALFAEVVRGSSIRVPAALRGQLPKLLWLLQLGIVLHWAQDESPGQQRTRQLVDGVVPLVGRLLRLTRVPGVGRAADELAALVVRATR